MGIYEHQGFQGGRVRLRELITGDDYDVFAPSGYREALYALMKYGRETNSWNEYIFLSHQHHQDNAIFLAGLPDVKGSLPHGELARR